MVNSNPETVSHRLRHLRPPLLRAPDGRGRAQHLRAEQPVGVIVQFGGQTPLNLARAARGGGRADHRHQPREHRPGRGPRAVPPSHRAARAEADAQRLGATRRRGGAADRRADRLPGAWSGRASSWAAGRWRSSTTSRAWPRTWTEAVEASPEHPILIDKFLEDAIEVDVDAVCDGAATIVGGVMEHIEEAGIHSGDSACAIPPYSLGDDQVERLQGADAAPWPRPGRARADEHPVRRQGRRRSTCSRSTRGPRGRCRSSRRRPG